jgi:hypothetical protein
MKIECHVARCRDVTPVKATRPCNQIAWVCENHPDRPFLGVIAFR